LNNFGELMKYNFLSIKYLIITIGVLLSFSIGQEEDNQYVSNDDIPLVSIHAEDTHLPALLAILASESGYNIVTGPNVQSDNKLTIHLDNVPIDQAVNLVIRAAGLSYEIVGKSILVANQAKIDEDVGATPHVMSLLYANAVDVAGMLAVTIPMENISIDTTGNKLLVSASPKKIAEVQEIVQNIDQPSTQIMLEARLIEVVLNETEELGIDWEKLAQTSIIIGEGLPLSDYTGDPNLKGYLYPGELWDNVNQKKIKFKTPLGDLPADQYWQSGSDINKFGRQLTAFDVTLDMLLKDNRAQILTNSQVVTVNGHEAMIEMVDEIPYLASSGGEGNTNFQVAKESVGIKLKILPYVNADGFITTKITPEVSSIIDWTSQGYPWTKKRISETTVRVQDGETIVIAGLISNEKLKTEVKVPLLWRIPIIGKRLFTHTQDVNKKTDLIIQVRPTIVQDNYSGIIKQSYHKELEDTTMDKEELNNDGESID
tara:strand:+ start:371 stop:1828 length:1458 start_codon:yes stop_codon:yes gene_type:complete